MQSAITQFRLGLETVAIIGIYYKNTYTAFSPSSQEKNIGLDAYAKYCPIPASNPLP
jgi:hypothetical protein